MMPLKKNTGVTLIELLISIAIVGILAGIAYPSYQNHILKSHRADAQVEMMKLVNDLERQYTETNSYMNLSDRQTDFYSIVIVNATDIAYFIQAIPIGNQQADACGTLGIDNFGNKIASLQSGCW